MDNASNALKVIKVDCGMLKYKAIMGDGIGSAIKASGLRNMASLGKTSYKAALSDKMMSLM